MVKRTLYFSNPAYLSLRNGQLLLRLPEVERGNVPEQFKREAERTFPIEDLGLVILDHKQIVVTHGVLESLLENNCAVVTCDSTHMPVGLLLPLEGNTIQSERFREQISCSKPLQKQLWQQTVQAKISNQAACLNRVEPNVEVRCMRVWSADVRSGDPDNLEARAAAYYWRNFFPEFPEFVRSRDGEYPNLLLNYGYAILRAIVARSLVGTGLLPTLGIHHHNRYNAYCLADDIMEPYRPYVDMLVKQIVRERGVVVDLDRELKGHLLSLPTLDVTIARHTSPLAVAVDTTCKSLQKCFAGEARQLVYPIF